MRPVLGVGTVTATDPLLRREVMACQKEAEDLRSKADEVADAAAFWAGLVDHEHDGNSTVGCEDPNCYEAWRDYPDG